MASTTVNEQLSPTIAPSCEPEEHSYGQILKSSALIGGSTALNIAIGVVRTKAMAAILGPSGFGLAGIYGSIADLAQSLAGLGVNSSGVRQIAAAAASGNTHQLASSVMVLRRVSLLLGVLGAALLVDFSRPLSRLTFGSDQHAFAISLLGLVVCFRLVSAGQAALLQGLRRIRELATMGVLGALFATLVGVPIVYLFGARGIAPSLVAIAGLTILTSWWYSRKVEVRPPRMTAAELCEEGAPLFKLGSAFMASSLMTLGAGYVVRITVLHKVGFAATGLYQSAWTLAGLYVGIILQAMGADFYPRLTASANDNSECNRLVNEQTLAGLLLAGPGVLATLTFAPLVLSLFYTTKFIEAVGLLRWFCLGMTLQVITWPMGFIIVAKSRQAIFFLCDLAWTIFHVGLAWTCIRSFGLNGAGVAYLGSYVFHAIMIYPVVRWLSNFRWSTASIRTCSCFLCLIAVVFVGYRVLPPVMATCVGSLATLFSAAYSIRTLVRLAPTVRFAGPIESILGRLQLASK